MSVLDPHRRALEALDARGRLRRLQPRAGADFASNDYLGLANSDLLRDAARAALDRGVGTGAGASRLLRGNDPEHAALEAEAAQVFGTQAALYLANGFTANMALFSSLPRQGDLILHDALIHASAHDGMRLGPATTQAFAHNDADAAETALRTWRAAGGDGRVWIAIEALYSMDGDFAPIDEFVALADRHDAMLVVDEAHATGLYGPDGRGLSHPFASRENVVSLHTCGKALGSSGALICGAEPLIDTLINRARGFIYSTAPAPLNAAITRAALGTLVADDPRRMAALQLGGVARSEAARLCGTQPGNSQIIPVIIGDDKRCMRIAQTMQEAGFDVRGIRPPTVPRGTARLRISVTPHVDAATITAMFETLANALQAEAA
ncbi:8-amino-7-oxononanoate synthase [Actibacterium mucosum KCTC 23349]|uniref:8-amino-7-oxononanoate synthase n=1 Tax=Actibacterium mucosum KCTC 23349 TaxID=1454373 RepID=A0A037ZLV1_9RHOB|nr:8-amino-7-oxononanoate synthase [Actibacterium mucosum]KAJ57079.1 8-amino-7-oxononanoate synthase [Actibacterium mucosum KCTC 23349]